AVVIRSRKSVAALDLQSTRHTTIESEDQSIVFREDVTANLSDCRVVWIRSGRSKCRGLSCSDKQRRPEEPPIERPANRRQVHVSDWRRQVCVNKVRQVLAIGEEVRSRDHSFASNLTLDDGVKLLDSRQLEVISKVLHCAWYQGAAAEQGRISRTAGGRLQGNLPLGDIRTHAGVNQGV